MACGSVCFDYTSSELGFGWLIPTDGSFAGGDRNIVSFLYRLDLDKVEG